MNAPFITALIQYPHPYNHTFVNLYDHNKPYTMIVTNAAGQKLYVRHATYKKLQVMPVGHVHEMGYYKEIIYATIDYLETLMTPNMSSQSPNIDYFGQLKKEADYFYSRQSSIKLQRLLYDLTELPRETNDRKFNRYIKKHTGHSYNMHDYPNGRP